ncbi:MAG: MFS transporter [Actinomycetota bacterium]
MLVLTVLVLALTSVFAARGRFAALAELRFNRPWALIAAFAVQLVIFTTVPDELGLSLPLLHICTYVLAGWFVVANRHVPCLWLIGIGGALNLAAISANGGVMPAAPDAVAAAGIAPGASGFVNSAAAGGANLSFLGDVFSIPAGWPFNNVFSLGDMCIVVGLFVAMHRICGSRLIPSGAGEFSRLLEHRDFVRLWGSQAISNVGDWIYSLAVATAVVESHGGSHALAFLLVAQVGPAAMTGIVGGPVVDRFSRRKVMLVADLARAAAVGSLLLGGLSSLAHLYAVAACLGIFEALFQPSLQASLPNLVPRERIVAANSVVSATFNFAVMGGPIFGGLLVAAFGVEPVLFLNAGSFLLSAVLVLRSRIPRDEASSETRAPLKDLVDGISYSIRTPLVRGILAVTGLVMFASAIRSPLEPLFVLRVLDEPAQSLGLLGGVWGLGMVMGSAAAPAAARAWPRERLLAAGIGLVGLAVLVASQALSFTTVLFCWLMCGIGNAIGTVSYESLLQERTPDALRGRVISGSEAALNIAYLAGASAAAVLGSHLELRLVYAFSGALLTATALLTGRLLGDTPHLGPAEEAPGVAPAPHAAAAQPAGVSPPG